MARRLSLVCNLSGRSAWYCATNDATYTAVMADAEVEVEVEVEVDGVTGLYGTGMGMGVRMIGKAVHPGVLSTTSCNNRTSKQTTVVDESRVRRCMMKFVLVAQVKIFASFFFFFLSRFFFVPVYDFILIEFAIRCNVGV